MKDIIITITMKMVKNAVVDTIMTMKSMNITTITGMRTNTAVCPRSWISTASRR